MKIPVSVKMVCAYLMAAILTNIPNLVLAEGVKAAMIPTTVVVSELTRSEAQAKVETLLNRADVRKQLEANGVSVQEATNRLASLSETEMKNLAGQMEQARAGGDILIVVLLVVLIIFLVQRI